MSSSPSAPDGPGLQDFCRRILCEGSLEAKLEPPPSGLSALIPAAGVAAERHPRPARSAGLDLGGGAAPLPRPSALGQPEARGRVLARLAHHELQAVELFAWALLRWPEAPPGLREGWLRVLTDEQRHCRLYLQRLAAHGQTLSDHAPHSDYFWRHEPALSEAGPAGFLCAMGLTLEQANLDFASRYEAAFRAAGDEASARVCARVHADEIGHVALAARWLRELDPGAPDDVARYERAVPFPFSAARAKGRGFDAEARRRAGLAEEFVDHVRSARSSQELRGRGSGGASGTSSR